MELSIITKLNHRLAGVNRKGFIEVFEIKKLTSCNRSLFRCSNVRKDQTVKDRLSCIVWECKYYIVCAPENHREVIYGQLRREVVTIVRKLCEYRGLKILEGQACH
jgi:hypothetical protein